MDDKRVYGKSAMLALYGSAVTAETSLKVRRQMPEVDFGVAPSNIIPGQRIFGQQLPSHTNGSGLGTEDSSEGRAYSTRKVGVGNSLGFGANSQQGTASGSAIGSSGVLGPISARRRNPSDSTAILDQNSALRPISGSFSSLQSSTPVSANIPTSNSTKDPTPSSRSDGLSSWRRTSVLSASVPSPQGQTLAKEERAGGAGFGTGGGLLFTSPTKTRRLQSTALKSPSADIGKSPISVNGFATKVENKPDINLETLETATAPDNTASPSMPQAKSRTETSELDDLRSPPANWDSDDDERASSTRANVQPSQDRLGLSIDQLFSKTLPVSPALLSEDPLLSSFKQNGSNLSTPYTSNQRLPTLIAPPAAPEPVSNVLPPGLSPPGLRPKVEDTTWFYKDPTGTTQGPFTSSQMQSWYSAKFFSPDLLIKRASLDEPFRRLDAYIAALDSPDDPFLQPNVLRRDLFVEQPRHDPWEQVQKQQPPHAFGYGQHIQQPLRQFSSNFDPFAAGQVSRNEMRSPAAPSAPVSSDRWPQQTHSPWGQQAPANSFPGHFPARNLHDLDHGQQFSAPFNQTASNLYSQQLQHNSSFTDNVSSAGPHMELHRQEPMPFNQIPQRSAEQHDYQQHEANFLASLLASPTETKHIPVAQEAVQEVLQEPIVEAPKPEPRRIEPEVVKSPVEESIPEPALLVPAISQAVTEAEAQAQESPVDIVKDNSESVQSRSKRPSNKKSPTPVKVPAAKVVVVDSPKKTAKSVKAPPVVVESAPEPTPPVVEKPAVPWSTVKDAATPTNASGGPSLRDIQAREAKEEEIRKAATKKVKAAALAAENARLAAIEEAAQLPASTNWAQPASATPVWSSTQPVKKTLKEIQQEEARQQEKRVAAQKSLGTVPTGKGYAGMLAPGRNATPPAIIAGPWSVVGSSGKSNGPPPVVSANVPPPVKAVPVKAAPAVTPSANKVNGKQKAARPESEASPTPSLDFLKWMRSALQGLTINIDDFINMLLTFPVNADSATLEIISDAVYLNSRTLDGRRFAETFVLKRKADVAAVRANPSLGEASVNVAPAAPAAPKTAAEALKSVPKKVETINFKTVKAKKKR